MAFLVNWMFWRHDKFDGPIFGGKGGGSIGTGGLLFKMLIGLHV